jgi:anti-sigma factor RsiW
MTSARNHEELFDMLPAAALEILSPDDLQVVLSHASTCAECSQRLEEYREVIAAMVLQLPGRSMDPSRSAGIRGRLLDRTRGVGSGRPFSRSGRWTGWAAVAASFAGALLIHHAVHRPLAYGWLVAGILLLILVGLALHLRAQRSRISMLRSEVEQLSRKR